MKDYSRTISVLSILFAAGGWASSGLFINGIAAHSDLSSLNVAFFRELFTFVIFLIIVLFWKPEYLHVKKKDLIWLALMGGIGIGYFHALWNTSVLINGMSIGTMLQYNEAVIIALAAVYFFDEEMHWRKIAAIAGSILGTALISGIMTVDIEKITTSGLLIGLTSAIAHSCFNLFGKKLAGSYSATTIMLYAFGFGTFALLPLQFISPLPVRVTPIAIKNLILLITYPTFIAFILFTRSLKWIPVSTANIIATSEVPMAALLGFVFLKETLDLWQTLGAGLVVVSVILVSLKPKRIAVQGENICQEKTIG